MKRLVLPTKTFLITYMTLMIIVPLANLQGNRPDLKTGKNWPFENSLNEIINIATNELITCSWSGATNSDWNTETNWINGIIPTFSANVLIPLVVNQPVINENAECIDITINTGASLTILNADTLTVSGNWNNLGTFNANSSTVIFNGAGQTVSGSTTFNNVTIGGTGIKTITTGNFIVNKILSMEVLGTLSKVPTYSATSILQYNTSSPRLTGLEWPSTLPANAEIIIKNSGTITLDISKNLRPEASAGNPLTIKEGATLDIGTKLLTTYTLNLECGGLVQGSIIKGIALLNLAGNIYVINAAKGTAGAIIYCPTQQINHILPFYVDDDGTTATDLTVSSISTPTFSKYETGTMSLGNTLSIIDIFEIKAGNFIIPPNGSVTAKTQTQVDSGASLIIESDESGTGSLITLKIIGNGIVKVEHYMIPGAWHIVSSPVKGQTISNFLTTNESIPKDEYLNRGMRDYDPIANLWNDFFTNATGGSFTRGKGYCMRIRTSQVHKVNFTGVPFTGSSAVIDLISDKWNCIGNPYTSAMRINKFGTAENFLTVNSQNLDALYAAIYVWDQPDASNGLPGKYTVISNASPAFDAAQGQGFMVKMKSGVSSLSLTMPMQVHNSRLVLKSTNSLWPTIKLIATVDSISSSTIIAFKEGMTNGLDPTYDAGLLKAGAELDLYTRLVEDQRIPFAIQALPEDNYENMVIPVGLDCINGGLVSFSVEQINIPSYCKAILEDKIRNTYTDLSDKTYTTDIAANADNANRFYLHTSYSTTGTATNITDQEIKAWAVGHAQIIIKGDISSNAITMLYDIQGRLVLTQALVCGNRNILNFPLIKPGIYMLKVLEPEHAHILKVLVS